MHSLRPAATANRLHGGGSHLGANGKIRQTGPKYGDWEYALQNIMIMMMMMNVLHTTYIQIQFIYIYIYTQLIAKEGKYLCMKFTQSIECCTGCSSTLPFRWIGPR